MTIFPDCKHLVVLSPAYGQCRSTLCDLVDNATTPTICNWCPVRGQGDDQRDLAPRQKLNVAGQGQRFKAITESDEGRQIDAEQPGIWRRAFSYGLALYRWRKKGKPVRDAQRIDEILAICGGCEHFQATDDGRHACGHCGCGGNFVGQFTGGLVEKIRMATEKCSAGNWPAEAD